MGSWSWLHVSFPVAASVVLGPVWLTFGWAIDTLFWVQHARYPSAWERDGRPYPVVMNMPGVEWSLGGWLNGTRCAIAWLLVTPPWAKHDPDARPRLRCMRVSAIVGALLVSVFLLVAIRTAPRRKPLGASPAREDARALQNVRPQRSR